MPATIRAIGAVPGVRPDAQAIRDHLRVLFGEDGGDAPGYLNAFCLPSRKVLTVAGDAIFGELPDRMAARADTEDVYIEQGLQERPPPAGNRGTKAGVLALAGFWFDLDEAGPNHKSALLPATRDESLDFLASLPLAPTLVNASGGGLQVYWCFREMQVCPTSAERAALDSLSARFQAGIIARGRRRGWTLDNTADLSRVLRPAGTLNHKRGGRALVRTLYSPSQRAMYAAARANATKADAGRMRHFSNTKNDVAGIITAPQAARYDLPALMAMATAAVPAVPPPTGAAPRRVATSVSVQAMRDLVQQLHAGVQVHDAVKSLAFRYLEGGMLDGQAVETIRGLLLAAPWRKGDRARWDERYHDVPRAVRTAREKISGRGPALRVTP